MRPTTAGAFAVHVAAGALTGLTNAGDATAGRTLWPETTDRTPWTVHHPPKAKAANAPLNPSAVGLAP